MRHHGTGRHTHTFRKKKGRLLFVSNLDYGTRGCVCSFIPATQVLVKARPGVEDSSGLCPTRHLIPQLYISLSYRLVAPKLCLLVKEPEPQQRLARNLALLIQIKKQLYEQIWTNFHTGEKHSQYLEFWENVTIDSEAIFCRLRHLIVDLGTKILASNTRT